MSQQGKLMLTLKVIAITLLVVSASIVLMSAVLSAYFEPFTLNPSSSASATTSVYNPSVNYTLTVTGDNSAVNVLISGNNTLYADLEVSSSFFVKAYARINVTSTDQSYEFQLETPQYWGIKAVANVYIPSKIVSNSISVSLQNGAINADVPNAVNSISHETTNGQINARGTNLHYLSTQSTNGNTYISVSNFDSITSSAVNGNVQATVDNKTSTGSLSLSTTNGNVNFYANPASNLTISASTVNGAVSISTLTVDYSVSSTRQLIGTLNGGGTSVVLATVNGNVRIGSSLPIM